MKIKNLIPLSLSLLILGACGNNPTPKEEKKYIEKEVTSYVEKDDITTYMFMPGFDEDNKMDVSMMSEGGEKSTTDGLRFFNGSTIPYMEVDNFVSDYMNILSVYGDDTYVSYSVSKNGKKVTIKNDFTKDVCIIDFEKGTFTFPRYTGFFCQTKIGLGIGDYIANPIEAKIFTKDSTYNYVEGKEVVIKMVDYNIQGYFYNDKGYLPYNTMNALLCSQNPLTMFEMFYNGQDLYMLTTNDETTLLNYFAAILRDDTTINAEFMQYNYDTLAFILDYHYGLSSRLSRVNGNYIKYLEGGVYRCLEQYKDRLLSIEPDVYDKALIEISEKYLDDGGHTSYTGHSLLQKDSTLKQQNKNERGKTLDVHKGIIEEKAKAHLTLKEITGSTAEEEEIKGAYLEIEDTAILTFDEFDLNILSQMPYEEDKYYLHTDWLVKYANKKIREDEIKNVIIDLSSNVGGIVLVEQYMESWLCQGTSHIIEKNVVDGSVTEMTRHADINEDGKLDENDYLSKDINVYCIISPSSFSCGNMLPVRLSEYSSTKFIGDRSGGGCCTIEAYRYLPVGGCFTMSSRHNSLTKDWRTNGGKTIDDGVVADFYKIPADASHYKDFCDYQTIIGKIHEAK